MAPEALYVGLDVAKAHMDVAVRPTNDRWAPVMPLDLQDSCFPGGRKLGVGPPGRVVSP